MKKTTKMAAVLAAMSVMVIGAVSTTMAANGMVMMMTVGHMYKMV